MDLKLFFGLVVAYLVVGTKLTTMKNLFLLLTGLVFILSSCDVHLYEAVDERNHFYGNYSAVEKSETFELVSHYHFTIKKSYDHRDEILIHNFYDVGITVYAFVDNGRITIPYQVQNGYEIEGTGRKYSETLEMTFSVFDLKGVHAVTDFCNLTARR